MENTTVTEIEMTAIICNVCGEDIDPAFIVDDYSDFGLHFCSEKCMREFENIGK